MVPNRNLLSTLRIGSAGTLMTFMHLGVFYRGRFSVSGLDLLLQDHSKNCQKNGGQP